MYILLSAHNPWFTPPSCTVSVYTVNSNSVPLSGSSAEHTYLLDELLVVLVGGRLCALALDA